TFILQVKDTQFRVNRDSDVLAYNSLAFHGMFTVPQPANETQIEGCPVVELTGDSVKDMELFLTALYNPYRFYHKIKLPFDLLACSLRLGRKYEAPTFKQDSVQRLYAEFPKTLDLWDKRQACFRLYSLEYTRPTASVLIDLLNLAYENGVYTCIPALSFRCLNLYPLSKLFEGIDREDGSRAVLPDATKVTLAHALESIQFFRRINLEWLREEGEVVPHRDCEVDDECEAHRQQIAALTMWTSRALEPWDVVASGEWAGRFCKEWCEPAARLEHEAGRRRAWDQLPDFFGLPEWESRE
ncbi:hypothetical protein DFH08DRAFT_665507, partial [Mycena albidolilacea]